MLQRAMLFLPHSSSPRDLPRGTSRRRILRLSYVPPPRKFCSILLHGTNTRSLLPVFAPKI